MPKTIDPIAAYLDAVTDAQQAGCDQAETERLTDIGEAYADFAATLAPRLNALRDGRMVTSWVGHGERRAMAPVTTPQELAALLIEGSVDHFDAVPLIKAAANLRLAPLQALDAAMKMAPTPRVERLLRAS